MPKTKPIAGKNATPTVKESIAPTTRSKPGEAGLSPPIAPETTPDLTSAMPSAMPSATPSSTPLELGQVAPSFSLPDHAGVTRDLASFRGKNVVLYFYPKDDTPGCTREACAFNDVLSQLTGHGAVVLGVSRDTAAAHVRFRKKYSLDFDLLTDADGAVHRLYNAWGAKKLYGKTSIGPLRTTVVIDRAGTIAEVFPAVKVDGHAAKVLEALTALT